MFGVILATVINEHFGIQGFPLWKSVLHQILSRKREKNLEMKKTFL
jgi:hypothetical protein